MVPVQATRLLIHTRGMHTILPLHANWLDVHASTFHVTFIRDKQNRIVFFLNDGEAKVKLSTPSDWTYHLHLYPAFNATPSI